KENPSVLLLFVAMALLFVFALKPLVDLDLHDKVMFGVPLDSMVWIIPFFLLSSWLVYVLSSKFLYSNVITWVHVLATIIPIGLVLTLLLVGLLFPFSGMRAEYEAIGLAMQVFTVLFALGRLVFVGNVGVGFGVRMRYREM